LSANSHHRHASSHSIDNDRYNRFILGARSKSPTGRGRSESWHAAGLRFSCHQCNACCRGAQPGWVYVSPRQVERIARLLAMTVPAFRARFLRSDEDGDTVLELKPNGDCVFWDEGCTVYAARPHQCRTFPFWPENLESPAAWQELKQFCHGIDEGHLYALSEIKSVLRGRATSKAKEEPAR
jgi:Fe-S-cluster containining protein